MSSNPRLTDNDCIPFKLGQLELRKYVEDPQIMEYWSELKFYKDGQLVKTEIVKIDRGIRRLLTLWLGYTEIPLVYRPSNLGARRLTMLCPDCGRAINKIFYKPFFRRGNPGWSCFRCHDLIHLTSKRSAKLCNVDFYFAHLSGADLKTTRYYLQVGQFRKVNYVYEQLFTEKEMNIPMKSLTIKITVKQVRELDSMMEDLGLRKGEIIRRALDEFMDRENLKKVKLRKLDA